MEDIDSVEELLNFYGGSEAVPQGRRQLNATLSLHQYAQLQALSSIYGISSRRLASDLLGVAVSQAYDVADERHEEFSPLYESILEGLEATEQ